MMKIDNLLKRVAKIGYPIKVLDSKIIVEGEKCSIIVGLFREADEALGYILKDSEGNMVLSSLVDAIDAFYKHERYVKVNRIRQREAYQIAKYKYDNNQ